MRGKISVITAMALLCSTISCGTPSIQAAEPQPVKKAEFNTAILNDMSSASKQKVLSDVETLEACDIEVGYIDEVEVSTEGNEYVMNYNGVVETISIIDENEEETTIVVDDGKNSNTMVKKANGDLYVDGNKIGVVTTYEDFEENIPSTYGTVWKSTKSLKPYGSLTSSDYSKYLTQGKQNLSLGKQLDSLTVTVLSSLIGSLHTYAGIAVSLAGVALEVKDTLQAVNPKTKYLGCRYTTYTTPSGSDYQYFNRFYANTDCTGKYQLEISYEHFIVY